MGIAGCQNRPGRLTFKTVFLACAGRMSARTTDINRACQRDRSPNVISHLVLAPRRHLSVESPSQGTGDAGRGAWAAAGAAGKQLGSVRGGRGNDAGQGRPGQVFDQ